MSQGFIPSPVVVGSGADQCRNFLKSLRPKGDSRELWIKFGHDSFYRAWWDENGNLSGTATVLKNKEDPRSRVPKGAPINDLISHLSQCSQKEDGGVFFVPTQPQGFPLADCVDTTDDIGIELDHIPRDAQLKQFEQFTLISGIEPASLLTSGGDSIHAHLKLDHHADIEAMAYLRRLAIIAFNADPVTVRPHQPMRLPGFYRKEKGNYQELLFLSDERYSCEQMLRGFALWFAHRDWAMPTRIGDQWWSEVLRPLYASTNPASADAKMRHTATYLVEGEDVYIERRAVERAEREAVEVRPVVAGTLVDIVKRANELAQVNDFEGVDWQGHNGHLRGQCPFHGGKTGNSAWLSDQLGGYRFHCSSCTDDAPRDLFEYCTARWGVTSINSTSGLSGKAWGEAAERFVTQMGYAVPEREIDKTIKKSVGSQAPEAPQAIANIENLESEFEEIRAKYSQVQDKVEMLTAEWEQAEGERKKELKEQLRNAKDLLKSLNSTRYNARVQLTRALAPVKREGTAETGFAKDLVIIQERLGQRLSYDVLRKKILLDGNRVDYNSTCLWLTNVTGYMNWNKGDSTLSPVILDMAKENQFCPVMEYLESLPPVGHNYLDECVPYIFGVDTPYVLAAFRAQLIGSVRRIYEPGCYHRLMPLIYGGQKAGKSNFVQALYGEFYSEGDLPMGDKDGSLMVQRCWAHEIAECDKLFRTREASTLKAFVSQKTDHFREPYGRATEDHPRRSVLWGTTNQKTLFTDPTGNTRYPVISIPDGWKIPFMWVRANRDLIWAAALDGYRSGLLNDIPDEIEAEMAEAAIDYQERDALFEPLEIWVGQQQDSFTLMEAGKGVGFEQGGFSKADQNRVTSVLRQLGYDNRLIDWAGKRCRRWAHYGKK